MIFIIELLKNISIFIEYNKRTIKDYEVYVFSIVLNVSLDDLYASVDKEFNLPSGVIIIFPMFG